MPGETGQARWGPMTGRGLGYCTGFTGLGRFFGGHGRGFRRMCLIVGLIGLGALWLSKNDRIRLR